MHAFTALLALCALVAAASAAAVKSDVAAAVSQRLRLCARSNPDFDECMKNRLQVLAFELAPTGIPEVGIPRGEPTEIPEMTIHYRNGNLSSDLRIRNSKTWGLQGMRILNVRSEVNDPEAFRFEVEFETPRIFTEGDYKVDARLVVPIITKGYYNITMTDVRSTILVSGQHYKKRGEDYVRITGVSMMPEVGDMEVFASNIIPGNPELSQYVLDVANRYWQPIYEQLLPETNAAWGVVMKERANRLFNRVPFDYIFPRE